MFPFLLQAWWVGDTFSADVWRICLNATNCTEIGYDFDGECEPDGEAQSEGRMLFPDSSPPPPSAYLLGGAWLRGGLEFWGVELSACWSWGRRLLETGGRVTKPEAGRATDPGCHRPRPQWGPSFPPLSLGQAELPSLTLSAGLIWHFLRSLLFYPSLPFIWAQGDLIGRDLIGVPVTSSLSRQPAVAETRELALWGAVSPYLGAGHSQYSPL